MAEYDNGSSYQVDGNALKKGLPSRLKSDNFQHHSVVKSNKFSGGVVMEKDKSFDCAVESGGINVIPDDEKKEWTAPVLTTWTIAEETQQVS